MPEEMEMDEYIRNWAKWMEHQIHKDEMIAAGYSDATELPTDKREISRQQLAETHGAKMALERCAVGISEDRGVYDLTDIVFPVST